MCCSWTSLPLSAQMRSNNVRPFVLAPHLSALLTAQLNRLSSVMIDYVLFRSKSSKVAKVVTANLSLWQLPIYARNYKCINAKKVTPMHNCHGCEIWEGLGPVGPLLIFGSSHISFPVTSTLNEMKWNRCSAAAFQSLCLLTQQEQHKSWISIVSFHSFTLHISQRKQRSVPWRQWHTLTLDSSCAAAAGEPDRLTIRVDQCHRCHSCWQELEVSLFSELMWPTHGC